MVTFDATDTHFSIDVEETPAPPTAESFKSLSQVCARQGKRLCTSDEWYVACSAPIRWMPRPGRSGGRTNWSRLGAAEERAAGEPALGVSTRTSEKQSEVRWPLAGRSEIVGAELGGAALLAGPNDASNDAWSVDCRARAHLAALALGPVGSIGVRCCQ
ncbi:MAG: hypothetical protein U0263_39100 [Polyangiaceae bacterium]